MRGLIEASGTGFWRPARTLLRHDSRPGSKAEGVCWASRNWMAAMFTHFRRHLQPGEGFLDVGCGWGALVIYAAQHYGARATGCTLSHSQYALQ